MGKSTSNATTQRQRVADSVREQILNGSIKPGEPLRQVPLSKQFGVAQSVIREGLQLLKQQGLVTAIDNLGVFVREMGPEELICAYEVGEVLEGLAAKLCCRTASRADVEWLEAAVHRIHSSRGSSKRRLRSELEREFHHWFLELSGNGTLIRQSAGYQFIGDIIVTDRGRDEVLKEHLAIVSAVSANRPDKAEKLVRQHVAVSAESIRNQLS